jgi:hypothetical protein
MNTVEVLSLRTTLLSLYISLFFPSDIVVLTKVVTIFVTVFFVMSVAPGNILRISSLHFSKFSSRSYARFQASATM